MNDEATIFEFEKDFAGSLRCIPMAVRFKLDMCAVKLSLRQWSRFTHEDRLWLLEAPCGAPEEVRGYRRRLVELIAIRADEVAKDLAPGPAPVWAEVGEVAPAVRSHSETLGLAPPSAAQWAALTPLQRFSLLKLTREGHDNVNFTPAMREFGVLGAVDA